jgi:dTDP-glucose pyrophosphorylase
MELTNIKKILIHEKNSVTEVINKLNKNEIKTVFVVNKNNKLLGTITDGDIRRSFLKNKNLKLPLKKIMNKNFEKIFTNSKNSVSRFENQVIPILDKKKKIVKIKIFSKNDQQNQTNTDVLIMAGGFGKRLLPYTKKVPKPMLKINNRPIIENIILKFLKQGFNKFYISTHYKSQYIKNYFKKKKNLGVNIVFLNEKKPLGTAGCLGLLKNKQIKKNILIHNADIISDLNYNNFIKFHNESKSDITMAAKENITYSPFGEINFRGIKVKEISEKPKNISFINAGIYILKSKLISGMKAEKLNMTDFIQTKIKKNIKVNVFPIHEFWSDIGRKEIFKKYLK